MRMPRPVGLALALILFAAEAIGGEASGRATVLDGDSLRLGHLEIRLQGIDAPEYKQTCGRGDERWNCGIAAVKALRQMTGSAAIRCTWAERDSYGRALATCYKDGENLNRKLVRMPIKIHILE